MKITKANLKLFDRLYSELMNELTIDLIQYKGLYMDNLKNFNSSTLDLNSVQELLILSRQAILHRLDLFKEEEISGDKALAEAKKLLDGE